MTRRVTSSLLTTLALVWFATIVCQAQQQPAQDPQEYDAWRASMKQTPLPYKGCFTATFPAIEWHEVACTTAPNRPIGRPRDGNAPTVGNGVDYSGVVTGLLTQAEGYFVTVSNVTSSNSYTLQLNTNTFTTSVCTAGCVGWQQFIYSSSPSSVFMQYWMINYGATCPSGWNKYSTSDCWKNSSATSVGTQSIANLPSITLTGKASGGTDTVVMDINGSNITAVGQDTVLNLEKGWNTAEYNVFGDCCGSQVNLNSNASLVAQVSLTNGTKNAPSCQKVGYTGETNNLSLIGPCCPYAGTTPVIEFLESNASGATASCGASAINTNILPAPYATNVVVTMCCGVPPSYINYSMTLVENAGSTIHMLIDVCQSVYSESSYPGSFDFQNDQPSCSPYGTMYATAPGYLQSATVGLGW